MVLGTQCLSLPPQGLLAEVEDDTAPGRQGKAAAGRRCTTAAPKVVPQPAKQISIPPKSACSPAASLTSRITGKESEALLELLLSDDVAAASEAQMAPTTAQAAASTAAGSACGNPTSTSTSNGPQQVPVVQVSTSSAPSVGDTQQPEEEAGTPAECSTGSLVPSAVAAPASCSSSDVLDDVIGLLNAPEVAADLASQHPSPSCSSHQTQQEQCRNMPEAQSGPSLSQQVQPLHQPLGGSNSLPQAACREAHRQSWARPPEQQQEALRAAAVKHESINAAWRGFYSYWGPHAASTIQHYWRAYRARQQYLQLQAAAVVLQAVCRGHLLRASSSNLLRLHRKEQRQQQRQLELERQQQRAQQQRGREERERRQQQERLQEQREREAALVLQCAVRGWAARRLLADLAVAAAAAAVHAAVGAGLPDEGDCAGSAMSAVPSTCSRASDSTDSCSNSRGSSRQSHSRGSAQSSCSLDASAAAVAACRDHEGMQQQQEWQEPEQGAYVEQQQQQHSLPGLVIRHAAEARTASHRGDSQQAGTDCREDLARQLVQRAGQLGVVEGMHAAQLATRALMASSSSRQLQSAMQAVRAARPTM